jgi:hypothetical protein
MGNFGKFKRRLGIRCPICGDVLEIRVRYEKSLNKGIEIEIPIEYIACSNRGCYYEKEIEQRRRRV